MALSKKAERKLKTTIKVLLTIAALVGVYACQKKRDEIRAEVQREIAAQTQESNAKREADPDYGPGGINRRISQQIAVNGAISGFVMKNKNMDPLIKSGILENHSAPMRGPRAGETHPGRLGNTAIHNSNHTQNVNTEATFWSENPSLNAPTESANTSNESIKIDYNRFRDTSGR